jgi:hypothetical protein
MGPRGQLGLQTSAVLVVLELQAPAGAAAVVVVVVVPVLVLVLALARRNRRSSRGLQGGVAAMYMMCSHQLFVVVHILM